MTGILLLLSVGAVLLSNPVVNVIDVLPDCLAWILFSFALLRFSWLDASFKPVRRKIGILAAVTLLKLLPMYWSVSGSSVFPLGAEPTMVLTFAFCFSVAEAVLGISAYLSVIRCLNSFAMRMNCLVPEKRIRRHRFWTFLFFLHKAVASVLPELVYLRSREYTGNVIYGVVIDIQRFRPYLIGFFAFFTLVYGIVWLIQSLRLFRFVLRDPGFRSSFDSGWKDGSQRIGTESFLFCLRFAVFLLAAASVFFCTFSLDGINYLPDAAGVLLLLLFAFLFRKRLSVPRLFWAVGVPAFLWSLFYAVCSALQSLRIPESWSYSVPQFLSGELDLSPEKLEILAAQYRILAAAAVGWILLSVFFWLTLKVLSSAGSVRIPSGATVRDALSFGTTEADRRNLENRRRASFVLFLCAALFEPVRQIPVFAFLLTPVALISILFQAAFLICFCGMVLSVFRSVESFCELSLTRAGT
ncbi:MAG: hypothetical protein J5938_03530 [Clostridia bacterium]|nr:hypothetical protein [Clostridia bacterium]